MPLPNAIWEACPALFRAPPGPTMAGNFVAGGSGSTMKSSFSGDGLLLRQSVYGNASPSEKMVSRLTSTARAAGQAILDHKIASPRAIARMRAENKVKRQELAGTQWQFGTKDDMADWRTAVKSGTELNSGMLRTYRLNQADGDAKTRYAKQDEERKERRRVMECGAGVRFDEADSERGKYAQDHKLYSSLQEARNNNPGGHLDTKAMVLKFKYASNQIWPSNVYDRSDFETDEKRRQRTLATACGSPVDMMRARRKLVEEGKEKKVAFQRGQIDCLRAHPNLRSRDGFYNRRTGDFDLPEAGPGRASLEHQKQVNRERKQALSGTQWQFGLTDAWQTDFQTTMHSAVSAKNSINADSLTELCESKDRAKKLKAHLTRTTIQLGGDSWG